MRYQIESTSVRDVCTWAGFHTSRCHAILGLNATVPIRKPPPTPPTTNNIADGAKGVVAEVKKKKFKIFKDAKWPEYYYNTTWTLLEEADIDIANKVSLFELICIF